MVETALQIDLGESCFKMITVRYSAGSGDGPVLNLVNTVTILPV
jgi:hypothetical protein